MLDETTNQTPEPDDEVSLETALVPSLQRAPRVPDGVTAEEAGKLREQARRLTQQIEQASGSQEMAAIDRISVTGIQAQRDAASDLNLLRGKVGDMLTRDGTTADLTKNMADLRVALNEINPHEFDGGGVSGLVRRIPFIGSGTGKLVRSLERVAIRYEPVSKQVTVIETRMREGRAMLAKDNIELRKLYEQVETQLEPVRRNAYLGEVLMEELTGLRERTDDPAKRERVTNALHDVAMRVQDLRTMEEVFGQFFVSIEMTRQNNTRLGQAVERTLALGTNVITVGLAIQMALARQRRVLEATQRTREFLGNLIVANAVAIKRHTEEIGDVFNNPVIAIDKITQAHDELVAAIEKASQLKEEGIVSARENIAKLSELASSMQTHIAGIDPNSQRAIEK